MSDAPDSGASIQVSSSQASALSAQEVTAVRDLLGRVRNDSWAGASLRGGMPRAKNLTVLPTASKDYRNQLVLIQGATGVADAWYICLKSAADTYSWVRTDTALFVDLSAIDFLVGTATGLLSAEIAVGTAPGGELGGTWANPTVDATHSGSAHSSLAPVGADYLVGTANGTLTSEIVVGTSPGGELGGTWASPTVDSVHSGSAHVAHDTSSASASGSVTMTTGATIYDSTGATFSVAAGTWLVFARVSISAPAAGGFCIAYVRDGSSSVLFGSGLQTSAASGFNHMVISAIVAAGGTTTFKVSATCSQNGAALTDAYIYAVRLA